MDKTETLSYLKNISLAIISGTLLLLPLFFLTNTTDFFVFPKQMLFVYATIVLLILWGIRMVFEKRLSLRTSPFNLPVFLFGAVLLVSTLILITGGNFYDSLFQTVPVIAVLFFYFIVVNTIDNRNSFNIALSALSIGAVLSSLLSILYYFKLYILPFPQIQSQYFTTFGSPVQHIAYLLPILFLTSIYVYRRYRAGSLKEFSRDYSLAIHVGSSVIILLGIVLTAFKIMSLPQKPILLPYTLGFQTALNSLAQDSARLLTSFLFGSGYGTFLVDFSRFHPASFNLNPDIWNLSFSFSSSYALELLSTVGVLGLIAFAFIFAKVLLTRLNPMSPLFVAIVVAFVLALFIPFSFTLVAMLFTLLAFYATYLFLEGDKRVYDIVISLVALRQGLLSFENEEVANHHRSRSESMAFPIVILVLFVLLSGFVGFFSTKLLVSDTQFAQSLQNQALSNGQKTYDLQRAAIAQFPYKADYYRIFSQVNLALANSLISNTPQGSSPSAQVQQTVIQLLQQSINSSRASVTLAPLTESNWENLGSVYRSLIGVGQNAEQFALASMNQAIALDPYNPRLRITMGGIFYQLGAYDQAQQQFQIAANMKPDYANAYYNLGHAYEAKNDFTNALAAYQAVQQLTVNDKASADQIGKEIKALQDKAQTQAKAPANLQPAENQEPIQVDQPTTQLPARPANEQVKVSPPPAGPEASSSAR
jgi:Tfp pilus assembly protein PilF